MILEAFTLLVFVFNVVLSIPIDNELVLKRQPIPGTKFERVCQPGTIDMLFVIDGSTSIGPRNFELMRQFLGNVVSDLPTGSMVAAVQFSGTIRTEFSFKTYRRKEQAEAALRRLPYLRGTTKIGQALAYVLKEELTEEAGDRPEIPTIVIIITDGRSTDDVDEVSKQIRSTGAKTIAIGVTNLVEDSQLLAIAGDRSRVFKIDDFTKLDKALQDQIASQQICQEVTVPPSFGEPSLDIVCGPNSISIGAETKNPFEGHVYVKGHFNEDQCRTGPDGRRRNYAGIEIPFEACDTIRRRSLNPRGIFVETIVVFKFHETFLTKVDRAYKVQCFYMEADKTVTSGVEVSVLTTIEARAQFPMPTCQYSVHEGSPNGPPVRFAVVGEPVYHVWECDNELSEDLFRMRVHSCYVDDTEGNRINLIDEDGCAFDKFLIRDLIYDVNNMRATVEAHVFKFADKPQLYFQCQVSLCVDLAGGCDNFPPPCIGGFREKRKAPWDKESYLSLDVVTSPIQVADQSDIDFGQFPSYAHSNTIEAESDTGAEHKNIRIVKPVCLTHLELFLFASTSMGGFILISGITVSIHMRSPKEQLMLW